MSSDLHVEPWCLRETGLDLDELGQTESLFSLANGHIGLRGNLDEGEPHKMPGTYLSGLYASRPLPYAEVAYGYPEDGQSVVNATNGKVIRLLVEDEPLDLRYGELLEHERELDFRDGVLRRKLLWRSPSGRVVKIKSTRMVSLVQRAIAAIRYEVESADDGGPLRVVVQSELVANEALPEPNEDDPRVAAAIKAPLIAESSSCQGTHATLVHRTPSTDLRIAAAMDHDVRGVEDKAVRIFCEDDLARMTVIADLEPGEPIAIDKFFAYGYSSERSVPALRDQVEAALAEARHARLRGPRPLAARCARRLLDQRRRRDRRRRRAAAGGPLRALPRAAVGGARQPRSDPGQGPDRRRLRRPRVLGQRDLRAAGAHLPVPARVAGGAALALAHARVREGARRPSSASRAPPSRGARSTARSARATGPPAPPPSTSTPASPTPPSATSPRPRTRSSPATRGSSCWSRRRGCGARSATTTPPATSASTASPARTSTRRSPTTTSTRT